MKPLTLFMLILFSALTPLAAQSGPQVIVDAVPKTPTVGERWVLTLLVDHDAPGEVLIYVPPLPSSLFLDGLSKTPRIRGAKTQTSIEYRFIPNAAGAFLIEPFAITTPKGVTITEAVVLEVLATPEWSGKSAQQMPQLLRTFWAGAPAQLAAGKSAVFTLKISGANTALLQQLPQQLFMPEVPPGVILASLPLSAAEKESGIVLKLILIPLNGDLRIGERNVQHENYLFEIPSLYVRITDNAAKVLAGGNIGSADTANNAVNDNAKSIANDATQFPAFDFTVLNKSLYRKFRRGHCEEIYNSAKDLWDSGLYAQALANLRRSERDHPQDKIFTLIRREAEESLGFFEAKNESRLRQKLLFGLIFLIIFIVIVTPFACLMLVCNTWRRRAAFFFAVVFAAVCFLYLYRVVEIDSVFKGADGRFAVTLKTQARRTADIDGEELYSFKEGQPVKILLKSDSWLYVKTNDVAANTGWIPADAAIFY